jgi:hypothetical protein
LRKTSYKLLFTPKVYIIVFLNNKKLWSLEFLSFLCAKVSFYGEKVVGSMHLQIFVFHSSIYSFSVNWHTVLTPHLNRKIQKRRKASSLRRLLEFNLSWPFRFSHSLNELTFDVLKNGISQQIIMQNRH